MSGKGKGKRTRAQAELEDATRGAHEPAARSKP